MRTGPNRRHVLGRPEPGVAAGAAAGAVLTGEQVAELDARSA